MSQRTTRIFWPVTWSILGLVALIVLLVLSATARDVAGDTAKTLFTVFTTPFIFETTVAVIGFMIVLGINHWRIKKEGDGWVYLVTQEPDQSDSKVPAAITQRLQGMVLKDKPEALDEAGLARARIEGFLELGMAAQAAEALTDCAVIADDVTGAALRIRVLAANLDTAEARHLLHASAVRFPDGGVLLAQTAVDCADWFQTHAPQQFDAARLWRDEVQGLKA